MVQDQDKLFMQRCIQLADQAGGLNAPNPRVGAVIVYNNQIIGEGYHKIYGEAHAEVNAVASVAEDQLHLLSKATIYVTLEPCFHFGKTPPCVDLVLKHKIPRVVIACVDPNSKVAGKSIRKLKEQGIEVIVGVLEHEGRWLTRRFFTNIEKQRPYIVLKFAQSKDGFIGRHNEETVISNEISKRLVHKWRSEETAILVGTNTALVDNPRLTNRLFHGRSPLRLVLDRTLRLPKDLYLFDGSEETWVFTESTDCPELEKVRYVNVHFEEDLFEHILTYLHQQKIQSILVEGGRQLLQSFIDSNLWDEARVLCSNICLEDGVPAPVLPEKCLKTEAQLSDNTIKTYIN
jgi:diaminohydroxyphosphoribosylaminopyrimidine deaminase / 5-amino-6-(5-phosphoribosylamino)uracil reductase